MDSRRRSTVGEFVLVEPSSQEDLDYLRTHLRPEEREEEEFSGSTPESIRSSIGLLRRTVSVFHNDTLICIGEMLDVDGNRCISCERTVHCLEKGHRFAWIKTFPKLVNWFRDTDNQLGNTGRFLTISPVSYPRAIDFYSRAGAVVIGKIDVDGRDFYLIDMDRKDS